LLDDVDVVVAADLVYSDALAASVRAIVDGRRGAGRRSLVADAGRSTFRADGMDLVVEVAVDVPRGVEGADRRVVRVFSTL
jgi:predicted nicotinamide N-methyase